MEGKKSKKHYERKGMIIIGGKEKGSRAIRITYQLSIAVANVVDWRNLFIEQI